MIKFTPFKTKNSVLKVVYSIVNLFISLIVGILNLLISFSKWIYKSLIKEYKYEFLYIAILSVIAIIFSVIGLNGSQKEQMYTWMGNSPSFVFIILLIISSLTFVFGTVFYILTIFKGHKVNKKYFWYIRTLSYFVTLLIVLFLVDVVVLDFLSRYKLVEKPKDTTSSYDVIIYFIREFEVNFIEGIKATITLNNHLAL